VATIPTAIYLLWLRISFRRITEGAHFTKAVYAATAFYFMSWIFKLSLMQFAGH
jgi:hypothetical protein